MNDQFAHAEAKHDVFLEIIAQKPIGLRRLKEKTLRPVLTAQEIRDCDLKFVLQQPGQIMVTLPVRNCLRYPDQHASSLANPDIYMNMTFACRDACTIGRCLVDSAWQML